MSLNRGPKIITDGLILCYDAGDRKSYPESGTIWYDRTRSKENGTLTNGPTYNSANGGSIVFDGTNDYVAVNANWELLNLQVPMTITCWARPTAFTTYNTLVAQYTNVTNSQLIKLLRIDNISAGVNRLRYFTSTSSGGYQYQEYTSQNVTTNAWQYFTAIVSGSISSATVTLGINNIFQSFSAFGTALSSTPDTTVPVRIGISSIAVPNEYFTGNIACVNIYNRALTTTELTQNFTAQRGRFGI
jgi:hypothetical protein